jgi:V8-like Glu-specific endopeptidase
MRKFGIVGVVLGTLAFATWTTTSVIAQMCAAWTELEIEQTKKELERIIADNPAQADNAKKTLETLTEAGEPGRRMRNLIGERGGRRIVNGMPAAGYPAVGALLLGQDPASARFQCTGTLVGCDKFLTAAHCIDGDDRPQNYVVFFQELGFFQVKEVRWPKQQYKKPYASYDLAMLTLARAADGIAPMAVNLSITAKPLIKTIATIVGFGRTGGERHDYGIRRIGSARVERCTSELADKAICWRYDALVKTGSASNTCNGDSGGGVFMFDHDGQKRVLKIFGVVSGGTDSRHCQRRDESYNVDVAEFAAWINDAGEGRLSTQQCGRDRAAAGSRTALLDLSKREILPLDVPAGTEKFRVAMNGEDNGTGANDFDLFVYRGAQIDGADPACAETGPGQFAFCEIATPSPGRWSVVVQRKRGKGNVQITATFVGSGAP